MNEHHWKIHFFILLTVIAIVTIAMAVVGMDIMKDLKTKQVQINTLIDEVGSIREKEVITNGRSAPASEMENSDKNEGKIIALGSSSGGSVAFGEQKAVLLVGQHSKLTDSIMLAVLSNAQRKIILISIPRDLFVHGRKINEYYEFFGIQRLADEVEYATGVRADDYVLIDMQAFTAFIDGIGGVDIEVEKNITDYSYPLDSTRIQTFSIQKGPHHMNGDLALKYARSRHSTSDFDRAKRQQQIIEAVKEKLTHENIITILQNLYEDVKPHVETSFSLVDALTTFDTARSFAIERNHVFSTEEYLYSTYSTGGQYILIPKKKTFEDMQNAVRDWINGAQKPADETGGRGGN